MPSKTIIAIIAITAIIITCLIKDIDGAVVATGASLIAGLGGFDLGKTKK